MSELKSLQQMNIEFNEYMCEPEGSFLWNEESVDLLAKHIYKNLSGKLKHLQDRLSESEKVIERYSPYCVPMFVETDSKEFKELKEIWLAREYQAKWKEKV